MTTGKYFNARQRYRAFIGGANAQSKVSIKTLLSVITNDIREKRPRVIPVNRKVLKILVNIDLPLILQAVALIELVAIFTLRLSSRYIVLRKRTNFVLKYSKLI